MTINFDLLISGCNTRCAHCYVDGGPGPNMPLDDALMAIERLDALAERLPYEVSFTLDNEPMHHPDIEAILKRAAAAQHCICYHHGMTSGIALMGREDRSIIMRTYLDCGYRDFGITLHGSAAHHDEIVRRRGAHQKAVEAAKFMKSCGAEVGVSLMLNRFFAEDASEIDQLLTCLGPDYIYCAIPNYTPHRHMMDFEPYRASLDAWSALCPWLVRWRQHPEALLNQACTLDKLHAELKQGLDIAALFQCPQEELYCTVHPDGNLFVGNTGVETELLGNLRTLDLDETAARICTLPGNRDYGAFYEVDQLPGREKLLCAMERLPGALLYSDRASALYRVLSELNVPTRICC